MKKIYVTVLFVSVLVIGLSGQSLRETVNLALENNPAINAQKESVKSAEYAAGSVYSGSLPSLSFDASYRYQSEVPELNLSERIQTPLPITIPATRIGANHNYEMGLTAQYALFTGFAEKSAITISRQKQYLNENNLSKTQKDIAYNTIMVYRSIQNLKLSLETVQKARERAILQLNRIKSLTRQGMALAVDTLSLALSKMSYEHEILRLKAELEKAEQRLETLAGQYINVELMEAGNIQGQPAVYNPGGLEDIKALDIQEKIIRETRNIRYSGYYPRIGVFAGYKYGKPGVDIVNNEWVGWGVIGASLSWNIFKWGADKKAVKEQEAELNRLTFRKQFMEDQAYLNYENAARDYEMMREQLSVIEASVRLAELKMKIIDTRYQEGMETVTVFNDTNLELTMKELEQKRHLIMMLIKVNELDYLSGKPLSEWSNL
ncbi:MAG: TolC family protein [Calditrichaceae bacterium]|nr:TolC family protein [Calditrichaceae bacterium]MBN2708044.1 TolC family protein [Calditrichaceae bacterium]RQV95167.1 MAG: TolC family protein [Calditrichota bacterium]